MSSTQEAPGSWKYASLFFRSSHHQRRQHRHSFSDVSTLIANTLFHSQHRPVPIRDTWKARPSKPPPDPRGHWLTRTYITLFISVALVLAVLCGSVFGILMYRPVMLINVAHARQAAAGSILMLDISFTSEQTVWSADGNIVLDLEVSNPSLFPMQLEIASALLTLVPYMSGSIDDNAIVSSMTPVSSLNLPVPAQSESLFTYMSVISDWNSTWLEPESAMIQCAEGYILFEAYLSEIIHYTLGGRAGEQTARTFPFAVPCVLVSHPFPV
eukprot:Gregarina_sp_Pseudo_9__706@NODE_144_length_3963_cov_52_945973_g132_i0_p2_GENE_NODE_144_length_3963_cov_52_945973_g132_i0NODE_144_length_3963_cov_52_945973_g132_i0_p2_ORF_typecomplete_len270_score2_15_NODE_144_length_3963_cov_52_945973_g132_i025873396